jgi:hypothetical protein
LNFFHIKINREEFRDRFATCDQRARFLQKQIEDKPNETKTKRVLPLQNLASQPTNLSKAFNKTHHS